MMDRKGWTITWAGIAAAVTLLATNGTTLLEVAKGTWLFLVTLSDTAPLGLTSFLLAVSLAMLVRPMLKKYLPPLPENPSQRDVTRRDAAVDFPAVVLGALVMFLQLRTLNGALLGIMAGLLAPQLAKLIAVLWGAVRPQP